MPEYWCSWWKHTNYCWITINLTLKFCIDYNASLSHVARWYLHPWRTPPKHHCLYVVVVQHIHIGNRIVWVEILSSLKDEFVILLSKAEKNMDSFFNDAYIMVLYYGRSTGKTSSYSIVLAQAKPLDTV